MLYRYGHLLLLTLCVAAACAQPDTLWTHYLGGTGDEYADGIVQTADGGFAVTGSTLSYGPSLDFYLAKLSTTGQLEWERAYGDSVRYETCTALAVTADGGFLLGGSSLLLFPFRTDGYLVKTDAAGSVQQARFVSIPDTQLSIFACGERDSGYWIAGNARIADQTRGFLHFLQADFTLREQHYFARGALAGFRCGSRLADGGFIFAGQTYAGETAPADAWVVRADSQGNELWNRVFGGSEDELMGSAFSVAAGGFIIGGLTTSFDDPDGSFYALRLNENGDSLWHGLYGEHGEEDHGHELIPTSDGGFLFAGHSHIDDGSGEQISVFKLAHDGSLVWQLRQGTADAEVAESVVETSDGGFALCAGSFSDQRNAQIWALRFAPVSGLDEFPRVPRQLSLLECYPNPFNRQTSIYFTVAHGAHVRLNLYDIQGHVVRTLQSGYLPPGAQRIVFDASGLASGVYYCRLEGVADAAIPIMLLK